MQDRLFNKFLLLGIVLVLLIIILFSFYNRNQNSKKPIICNLDGCLPYMQVIQTILPDQEIRITNGNLNSLLENQEIAEVFDMQAMGIIDAGIAKYWYPHYLATVVIAVNRDRTTTEISKWQDLYEIEEEISFINNNFEFNNRMLIAAMSYGLEGEDYSIDHAIQLLQKKKDHLKMNSVDSPILICYDYQARNLIQNGKNLEIIFPQEGTLAYQKGLLSNRKLEFKGDLNQILIENGLNPIPKNYIFNDSEYKMVKITKDYHHFAKATNLIDFKFKKIILQSKILTPINAFERLWFALTYICLIAIWGGHIIKRSTQKGINYSIVAIAITLNAWALVRIVKYQIGRISTLSRYLWYSYYIFQISLPLILLWMAWSIDKPRNEISIPKWWKTLAFIGLGLLLLVFTNDLHRLVFILDFNDIDWADNYSYGIGYFCVLIFALVILFMTYYIMIKKSIEIPRKRLFILPIIVFACFGLYSYLYIIKVPLFFETDITIVTGIFVMLMLEIQMTTRLIPANTKHLEVFKNSPLRIQIVNQKLKPVISSIVSEPIDLDIIKKVITLSPVLLEENSLLFAHQISGGYTLWCEDISKIQKLQTEIQETTKQLTEANEILAKESKIKQSMDEEKAKRELMTQLENEIRENIEKISEMIDQLESLDHQAQDNQIYSIKVAQVALMICYLKRKSGLFFKEQGTDAGLTSELILYINELCDIAKYSKVQMVISEKVEEQLPIRYITLFYDFFWTMVELAVQKSCPYIIINFERIDDKIVMQLLPSIEIGDLKTEKGLIDAISKANGEIIRKKIDDTIGISISFGGLKND